VMRILLVLVFFLSSCATLTPLSKSEVRCLPPGVSPAFLQWRSVALLVALLREDGVWLSAVRANYGQGMHLISTLWIDETLLAFDPAPRDPEGPVAYRTEYMARAGPQSIRVRAKPGTGCSWDHIKLRAVRGREA
jgi:hypothetical protein